MKWVKWIVIVVMMVGSVSVAAASDYNESRDGDLSNDRLNPTVLTVSAGDNRITATSIQGDPEYFTVTVPDDATIDQIVLEAYTSDDDRAFLGVQAGTIMTVDAAIPTPTELLGWVHLGPDFTPLNTNMLDQLAAASGAIGFTPPLPAGDYTFWTQQTSETDVTTYTINIHIDQGLTAVTMRSADLTQASSAVPAVMLSMMLLSVVVAMLRRQAG